MALASWPGTVPYEQSAEGASASPSYRPPISSETEGGPDIMRPRPGPRMTEVGFKSIPLTDSEWTAFEAFVRVTLRDGTLPFVMPVFKSPGYDPRTCMLKSGIYNTDHSKFPLYLVSFTLVVFNW